MNVEYIKFLLLPIISDRNAFSVEIKQEIASSSIKICIQVSSLDIKKIIGYGGKMYRSIKTLLRYASRNHLLDLIVDMTEKK